MDEDQRYEKGLEVRKAVLGSAHVDRSLAKRNDFNTEFQALITRYAWGEIWTRPGLPRHTRSLLTIGLMVALAFASVLKARLLSKLLGGRVSGWRWALVPATAAALVVGAVVTLLPEWLELGLGVPLILAAYGAVVWYRGFGHEDRELFRMKKKEEWRGEKEKDPHPTFSRKREKAKNG